MALDHVIEHRILHRNFSSSHIYVSKHDLLKLGSFGNKVIYHKRMDWALTQGGCNKTTLYIAPEVE